MIAVLKDYNDLLKNGIEIASLKTVPLDIAALEIELDSLSDKESEYRKASAFCRTVKDGLVKSDIAELLADRWNKPVKEIKQYLQVDADSADELLALAHGVDDCFADFKNFLSGGVINLGLKSIDESIGGIQPTDVIGLAAYSNHGKSFLAAKIAAYQLVREKRNVLIISREMTRGAYLQSIVQNILHMPKRKLMDYINTDQGAELYGKVTDALSNRLRIVDEGCGSINAIWKLTQALNTNGFHVDFVIVDHFMLLDGVSEFTKFEEQANMMKAFTKHFKAPLLMLTQFNDASLSSMSKKKTPTTNTNNGSNAFIAVCDVTLLLWRPALLENSMDSIAKEENKDITYIKISKSRRELEGPVLFKYKYNKDDYGFNEVPLGDFSDD